MANFSRKIDIYHTGKSTFGTPQNCIKCHFRVRVLWAGCVERAEENNGAPLRGTPLKGKESSTFPRLPEV
jgi:hypothetical protein